MPRSTVATNSIVAGVIMMLALVAGCAVSNTGSPTNSSCDGIDAQLGGCDPDRPTFVGQTCETVGHEAGKQLNDRLLLVYPGPAVVGNESRAVRANHVMTVTMSLANAHLRSIGIIKECGVVEFVAAAESEFTAEFRSLAGVYLNDGPAMTFDDWLAEWKGVVQIIDMGEG